MKFANSYIGCDKTVPAQIMGGISANKPVLPLVTGPMIPGSYRGQRLGACTDCRSNWAAYRAGSIDMEDIGNLNEELAPSVCSFFSSQIIHVLSDIALGWNLRSHGHSKHHGMHHSSSGVHASPRCLSTSCLLNTSSNRRRNWGKRSICRSK